MFQLVQWWTLLLFIQQIMTSSSAPILESRYSLFYTLNGVYYLGVSLGVHTTDGLKIKDAACTVCTRTPL